MTDMTTLDGKNILLVISGGIAAYKSLELIRALRQRGAGVRGVLTPAAHHFVTPLSVASLSGQKTYVDLFSLTDEAEMGHIELSRSADLIVVAPASADILAKMAAGLANDLASTLLLATNKRILVAPAMNVRMWAHPATQRNIAALRADNVGFVGPADGEMACGEYGPGRMAEPLEICAAISELLAGDTNLPLPRSMEIQTIAPSGKLAGRRVIVTAGPTHEPIDPVRYIANRSSGKQGYAIAAAAAAAGAAVTLVSGPVSLAPPHDVETVQVETAAEMLEAVQSALPADIFIAAAAVADWRVDGIIADKVKKRVGVAPVLTFIENQDILQTVAQHRSLRPQLVVGFAAETSDLIDNARNKLTKKGCDIIVANDVRSETGILGGDFNTVHIISKRGVEDWPNLDKAAVASRLIQHLFGLLQGAEG